MQVRYMKRRILVIIVALFLALAAILIFYEPYAEEQEFRGTFVRGPCEKSQIFHANLL